MEQILLQFPEEFFARHRETLEQRGLIAEGSPIGNVYLPGDWNDWGESPKRAGCVKPVEWNRMMLVEGNYVITVSLPRGIHRCKPVIVTADPFEDGMASATWIRCPPQGWGIFTAEGSHGNWEFTVT